MECPRCGYALSEFDESCPRCARLGPRGSKQCPVCGAVSATAIQTCHVCGYRFSERDVPLPRLRLASYWRRLLAHAVDGLVLSFVFLLLVVYPRPQVPVELQARSLLLRPWYPYVAGALIFVTYHGLFVGLSAATLGKKLLGLQVRRTDGKACSLLRAFLRSAAQVLTLLLGFVAYPLMRWATAKVDEKAANLADWAGVRVPERAAETLINETAITLCLWLGALLFLWTIYDRHRRGLHDRVAGTVVITGREHSR